MQLKTCQWCENALPDVETVIDPVPADNDGKFVEVDICGNCYKERCHEL